MSLIKSLASTLLICTLGLFPLYSPAEDIPFEFNSPEQQERFRKLTEELRCLVCQNQSLADSHAELAQDLRNEVYKKLMEGHSNEVIITYLVDRYGDFVLYRPPLKSTTYVLWFGPLMFLIIGGLIAWLLMRKKPEREITAEEREMAAKLLREENNSEGKSS